MMIVNARPPGRMRNVGTPYFYNAGQPIPVPEAKTPTPSATAGSPDGLGSLSTPAGLKLLKSIGSVGIESQMAPGTLAAAVVLQAIAGYFVGKALTPRGSSEKTWAWIGAVNAPVFGILGLGVQGIVAGSKS